MPEADRADVLLIGGGVAAARCARTLRREQFGGRIVLAGAEPIPPYNRPPLSKELLRDDLPDEQVQAQPGGWYERNAVELRLGAPVAEIDLGEQVATLGDGTRLAFERCLVATGAEPRRLTIDGAEHALMLRTLDDARRLRSAAVALAPGSAATVIGGGFIGIEVASALATLGLQVTVVEMADRLWGGSLGDELAAWAAARLADVGVSLRLGAGVDGLTPDAAIVAGERLGHEMAVAGIGVVPRVDLGRQSGLALDDGIVTDASQRTGHAAVWAAGDVARVEGRRVEHWHAAREAGERAARSMLGQPTTPIPAPWFFSEVAGSSFDVFGAADGWDEERWIRPGSVLAWIEAGRVVQLAVIGSAVAPDRARLVVTEHAPVASLGGLLAAL